MDKLHREHNFVTEIWQMMKKCECIESRDDSFWCWVQAYAERLSQKYADLSYAADWLISYMKSLEGTFNHEQSKL